MKKFIATLITLAILSMAALPAAAQTRNRSYANNTGLQRQLQQQIR